MILRLNHAYRVHEVKYQYIYVTKSLGTQCLIGKTPQGTQFTEVNISYRKWPQFSGIYPF